ncbi:hypothetical protein J2X71_005951 [Rhizobium sp. 1399]|jgi:hypothetical protein|nr:hypothetical protein [Rhizobium sp. 1399]
MLERANYLRDSTELSADPFSGILKFASAETLEPSADSKI